MSNPNAENLSMVQDRVLVRQSPKKERLESGLFIPDRAARELQEDTGVVVAVGPGSYGPEGVRIPVGVNVGDRVLFKRRPGSALCPDEREQHRLEWKDLIALREEDILLVFE